jgi:hypothetical protein
MEWSGRAPAPPACDAGMVRVSNGAPPCPANQSRPFSRWASILARIRSMSSASIDAARSCCGRSGHAAIEARLAAMPHHPRQNIQARQSLSACPVRAGGLVPTADRSGFATNQIVRSGTRVSSAARTNERRGCDGRHRRTAAFSGRRTWHGLAGRSRPNANRCLRSLQAWRPPQRWSTRPCAYG